MMTPFITPNSRQFLKVWINDHQAVAFPETEARELYEFLKREFENKGDK